MCVLCDAVWEAEWEVVYVCKILCVCTLNVAVGGFASMFFARLLIPYTELLITPSASPGLFALMQWHTAEKHTLPASLLADHLNSAFNELPLCALMFIFPIVY